MFFFECSKIIADEGEVLRYVKNECFVQVTSDDVMVAEYVVPILFSDENEDFELDIYLDETIINCFKIYNMAKVDSRKIIFDQKLFYTFDKSSEESLETQFPNKCCILTIPKIPKDLFSDNERLTLSFSRDLFIKNDVGLHLKFTIEHLFEKCETFVNSNFLLEIFNQNQDKSCVVYCQKDLPLCFEFFEPKKRLYLAPLF